MHRIKSLAVALLAIALAHAAGANTVKEPSWSSELDKPVRWQHATTAGTLVISTTEALLGLDARSGKVAWRQNGGQAAQKVAGEEAKTKLRDARFHSGLEMFDQGQFTHEGQKKIDGKSHHVLKATFKEGSLPPTVQWLMENAVWFHQD